MTAASNLPSIRFRLTAWLLGISLVFAAITAGSVWFVMNHEMDEMMNQELRESGELIYHLVSSTPLESLNTPHNPQNSDYEEHLVWQLIDLTNHLVIARSHKAPESAILQAHVDVVTHVSGSRWHATTFLIKYPEPRLLVVAQDDAERNEAKEEGVLYAFICAALSALLVSILLNWRIKRELLPLKKLSIQVHQYDPTSHSAKLDPSFRLELEPIEESIRDLGKRLSQRISSEKAFVSHAAHALRTPVAGIEAQLAIAEKEVDSAIRPRIVRARAASQRLRYVMQALLSLFRSGMEPNFIQLNLEEFVQTLEFPHLKPSIVKGGTVTIDPDLFAAVLFNLLDNSHSHHAEKLTLHLSVANDWHSLVLQDDGEGCSIDRLDSIREALKHQDYRPESGLSGLGLVLADLVMRAHHGRVEIPNVEKGFCVKLVWPINRDASNSI